jgi:hypothetical protein
VHRLIEDGRCDGEDRRSRKDFMAGQLREMKELLRMAFRRPLESNSPRKDQTGAPGPEEGAEQQPQPSQAILASMLLRARSGLGERGQLLDAEEARLAAALKPLRRQVNYPNHPD